MNKIFLVILAAATVFSLTAAASAFTIHERYSYTDPAGKVTVFYTIVIGTKEADNLREEMNKILAEIIYNVYPREKPEIRDNLAEYHLQIAVNHDDGTTGYFEWPVPKSTVDQILEEDLEMNSI